MTPFGNPTGAAPSHPIQAPLPWSPPTKRRCRPAARRLVLRSSKLQDYPPGFFRVFPFFDGRYRSLEVCPLPQHTPPTGQQYTPLPHKSVLQLADVSKIHSPTLCRNQFRSPIPPPLQSFRVLTLTADNQVVHVSLDSPEQSFREAHRSIPPIPEYFLLTGPPPSGSLCMEGEISRSHFPWIVGASAGFKSTPPRIPPSSPFAPEILPFSPTRCLPVECPTCNPSLPHNFFSERDEILL